MRPQPHEVAARLGFDERTIGRLEACGHLRRLALTEPQIRARLYRVHLAYVLAQRAGRHPPATDVFPRGSHALNRLR